MNSVMEYGERFRRHLTVADLVKNYDNYAEMLRDEYRRIQDSSEARKYITRNISTADPVELLAVACRCIYDLTGDTYFERFTRETLEEHTKESRRFTE